MTTTTVVTCPGPLVDSVTRSITALRTGAPGTGAGDWMATEREATIAALDAAVQDLTVYRGQVLLAHKEAGRWGSVSDRDFADYRSRQTGTGRGAAVGDLRLAQGLQQMPAVADAVERGELNLEHARALSNLHDKASTEVKDALAAGGLNDLLQRAARQELSAPDLGKEARAWAAKVDAAAAQEEFDAVHRRRSLTMRKHAGGVAGEFFLDPIAGEHLRTALEAISGPPAKNEDRTRDQRMADALTTMASRTLQVGADLTGAQVRPHISLLITEQTWVGIAARRRQFESCPTATRRPPWPNVPPGQLEDGTIVPLGELERLICDSEITRIVMNAAGIPLDVGRTQRTYTKELRRAVLTRDRHCMWPGCRIRASWSEVHHITYFSRGGTTSLAQGICLCTYHHHLTHRLEARITPLPDGFDFHHPDGTHIGTTQRQPPDTLLPCATAAGRHTGSERLSQTPAPPSRPGDPTPQSPAEGPPGRPSRPSSPGEGTATPPGRPGDVQVLPPQQPAKLTGPTVASRSGPLPSHPSTYASAPPTLWDPDPPF